KAGRSSSAEGAAGALAASRPVHPSRSLAGAGSNGRSLCQSRGPIGAPCRDAASIICTSLAILDPRRPALPTSRVGGLRGLASTLLKPIYRPPLPALGHSRNRKQPRDVIAITGVDAKYVPDGKTMSRPLEYPDLVTRPYRTLCD